MPCRLLRNNLFTPATVLPHFTQTVNAVLIFEAWASGNTKIQVVQTHRIVVNGNFVLTVVAKVVPCEGYLCSSCMSVAIHKSCAKTMEKKDSETSCKPFMPQFLPQFTTTNKRGLYKCSTCGQPTKGHKCPGPVVSVQSFLGEL